MLIKKRPLNLSIIFYVMKDVGNIKRIDHTQYECGNLIIVIFNKNVFFRLTTYLSPLYMFLSKYMLLTELPLSTYIFYQKCI